MDLHESFTRRPHIQLGMIGAVIVLAFAWIFLSNRSSVSVPATNSGAMSFYTDDDGKTFFRDALRKVPPFNHGGRTAYRCYVFTCDGGKTQFVGYLESYTPEARKAMEYRFSGQGDPISIGNALISGILVKRPGEATWRPRDSFEGRSIRRPARPSGATQDPEPVLPWCFNEPRP